MTSPWIPPGVAPARYMPYRPAWSGVPVMVGPSPPLVLPPVTIARPPEMPKKMPVQQTEEEESPLKNLASMLSRIPKAERTTQEEGTAQSVFDAMAEYTVENSPVPVKILNFWMHIQDLLAAPLHGGEKLHRWRPEPKPPDPHSGKPGKKRHTDLCVPDKYSGIWPGIYKPGNTARKRFIDPFSLLGCTWDSFNAFFNYASQYDSIGTGLVAGLAEAVNVTGLGYYYAEDIMYPCMDKTMAALGRIIPRIGKINRELAGKAPKLLTRKKIPLDYRLARSLGGGAVALAVIEGLIRGYSRWVTPLLAKTLGPRIDAFFGHNKERAQAHLVHHVIIVNDPRTGQHYQVVQPMVIH